MSTSTFNNTSTLRILRTVKLVENWVASKLCRGSVDMRRGRIRYLGGRSWILCQNKKHDMEVKVRAFRIVRALRLFRGDCATVPLSRLSSPRCQSLCHRTRCTLKTVMSFLIAFCTTFPVVVVVAVVAVVVVVEVVAEEEVVVIIVVEVLIVAAACHTNDVIHWDLGNRRNGTGDRQEAFKAMFWAVWNKISSTQRPKDVKTSESETVAIGVCGMPDTPVGTVDGRNIQTLSFRYNSLAPKVQC